MRTSGPMIALATCLLLTPVEAGVSEAQQFWKKLHKYELTALNDYRSRNSTPAVLRRSQEIWELQSSSKLGADYSACASAAQNLSLMVSSTYYDSNMGRIHVDWYYLSTRYRKARGQCLDALGLSSESYPLPMWFGL